MVDVKRNKSDMHVWQLFKESGEEGLQSVLKAKKEKKESENGRWNMGHAEWEMGAARARLLPSVCGGDTKRLRLPGSSFSFCTEPAPAGRVEGQAIEPMEAIPSLLGVVACTRRRKEQSIQGCLSPK